MLNFSDFTLVSDNHGGGTVLVPLSYLAALAGHVPPDPLEVLDLSGRSIVYEHSGPTYYSNADGSNPEFVRWSYWESESTEDPTAPIVHLMVLSPTFNESDYR